MQHAPTPTVPEWALRTLSFEEFLEVKDDRWAEWVDGKVILLMTPVRDYHDDFSGFFYTLLRHFAEARGGRSLREPFVMKTGPSLPGRCPDAFYVTDEHLGWIQALFLRGPADVAVEVISPDSGTRDREEKHSEYEKGGVREYWLIDPESREAEFFVLGDDGRYQRRDLGPEGVFHSTVLEGAWIRLEWLRADRLPTVLSVLREWGLV